MKPLRRLMVLALSVVSVGAAVADAEPATALLRYVPEEAEVAVGLDLAVLRAHPRFDEVFGMLAPARFAAKASEIEQITGVNVQRARRGSGHASHGAPAAG